LKDGDVTKHDASFAGRMSVGEFVHQRLVASPLLARRRQRRAERLLELVELGDRPRVLDVGCGTSGRSFEDHVPHDWSIVGVDLYDPAEVQHTHPKFEYRRQDASDLSNFADGHFDLVVSIGMMEHICEPSVLSKMASEIDRIGRQYVIVVPWRYAWLEPHFKFPFFQLFPYEAQNLLVRAFDLHRLGDTVRRDPTFIRRQYQWLTSSEWAHIWPHSRVVVLPSLETIAIVKSARGLPGASA
jgi:SAM-dependent methyltransferase